jgi:hypothetical protein
MRRRVVEGTRHRLAGTRPGLLVAATRDAVDGQNKYWHTIRHENKLKAGTGPADSGETKAPSM